MKDSNRGHAVVAGATALVLVVGAVGCSHVKKEDLNTRLDELKAELRSESEQGDQRLAERIDTVDARARDLDEQVDQVASRVNRLQSEFETFRTELDTKIVKMEKAIAFHVPVHFDFDSDELRDADRPVLDRFASVVDSYYPESLITVEGFTDPAGSDAYNRRLGQRRADAVAAYLVETGDLNESRLRTVSYGEAVQRQVERGAHGPGDEGLENRRVVLVIDHGGTPAGIADTVATGEDGSISEGESSVATEESEEDSS